MGSNRKLILGAVLLVSALVFWRLLSAINNVSQRTVAASKPAPSTKVAQNSGPLVAYAAEDIPQGTLVTKSMMQMRSPGNGVSTSAFITNPENQAYGYITSARISKGTVIRPGEDFLGHISETGVAGMLRPGTRAIVIPFANKPTLHDLVAIGNFVDVNAAFDGQESRTIVPEVRVLAVDVFGSDFPQVNIARRGAFKADVAQSAAPATSEASAPGATPTPTPAPAQAPARPDPSITLEVSPAQANTILLAQASGGVLDFVVLPLTGDPIIVVAPDGMPNGVPSGELVGGGTARLVSSVTKAQIAPYAERKKAAGGASATRIASANSGSGNSGNGGRNRNSGGNDDGGSIRPPRIRRINNPYADPPFGSGTTGSSTSSGSDSKTPFNLGTSTSSTQIAPPAQSPTYDIPIYADGRTVRVETVRRPIEPRKDASLPTMPRFGY